MPHLTKEEIVLLKQKIRDKEIKVGTFDLETSYVLARIWDTGKQWVAHDQIVNERKIITAQFMYSLSNAPQYKMWKKLKKGFDDENVVKWIVDKLNTCDIIIAQNGKQFDLKVLQERALLQGVEPVEIDFMIDTLTTSRSSFKSFSHSLDHQSSQLGFGGKIKMERDDWVNIIEKGVSPKKKMVPYGLKDIVDTDKVLWAKLAYYELPKATISKIRKLLSNPTEFCTTCRHKHRPARDIKLIKKGNKEIFLCNNCNNTWVRKHD